MTEQEQIPTDWTYWGMICFILAGSIFVGFVLFGLVVTILSTAIATFIKFGVVTFILLCAVGGGLMLFSEIAEKLTERREKYLRMCRNRR